MTTPPDGRATYSASVGGSVAGHLLVGVGNQVIEDAAALLGPPHTVDLPYPLVNLPGTPARVFVGRDAALAAMDEVTGFGPLRTYAVHGLGGVGKSELVLHYAYRHRAEYAIQWWITADAPDRIEAGLAALTATIAARAGRVGPAAAPDAAHWAVGFLASHPGWLLVLDNVEDAADLDPWLAILAGGTVVVTSRRDADWAQIVDGCVRLEQLAAAAAVDLLIARSRQADRAAATDVATELACLPLALTQVGAYLAQTRTSLAAYLSRLRERPATVLAVGAAGTPSQRTVARVWDITLASIAATNVRALDVLWVLSCLAPDDVPRGLLGTLVDDPAELDGAYGLLASYSMITLTEDTVSTHRLVQAVVADQAAAAGVLPAVRAGALDTLVVAMPEPPADDVAQWPRWAALVPHVRALAAMWPTDEPDASLGTLLGWTAMYLFSQGTYAASLAMQERALAILEPLLGLESPQVAVVLDAIALCLLELGRPGESVPLQRRAVAITEAAFGGDYAHLAKLLDNLAASVSATGDHDEAMRLRSRALAITEATLGPDSAEYAVRLGNMATTLYRIGRADRALPLERRALAIAEAALGPDHPAVALRLDNLAASLVDLDLAAEAEPLQRRATAISEATLGPDHPDVAVRLANLAVTLEALGRPAEAEPLERRALAITEAALGPDHPDVAICRENLAMTLRELGRPDEL